MHAPDGFVWLLDLRGEALCVRMDAVDAIERDGLPAEEGGKARPAVHLRGGVTFAISQDSVADLITALDPPKRPPRVR
jgi:hypothetical protein